MPIFEVEKNGELFELDAPDLQSAAKALSAYTGAPATPNAGEDEASIGGFISNVAKDATELAGGLYQAVRHPINTAQAVAENPYGLVEPFVEMAQDPAGYAYERPLSTLLNVSGVTGVGGVIGTSIKAGGRAGQVARAATAVSRATDPFLLATKLAGSLYKGTKRGLAGYAGATSATHLAPRIAGQIGEETAYEGSKRLANKLGANFDVPAQGKSKKDLLRGHMADKRDPFEGVTILDEGARAIREDAGNKIRTGLQALYKKDPKPFTLSSVRAAWEKAWEEAHRGGTVARGSGAAAAVLRDLHAIINRYDTPPNWSGIRSGGALDPIRKFLPDEEIRGLNLDPRTATVTDYMTRWYQTFRGPDAMDDLKVSLERVYPGYKDTSLLGKHDAFAKKLSKEVVDSVKGLLQGRYGKAYEDLQAAYGKDMGIISRIEKMFGQAEDTKARRVTSAPRDTAFTDYGGRLKALDEFAARVKQAGGDASGLKAVAAGRTSRSIQPRNMIGLASGVGLGLGTYALTNPLAGAAVFLAHTPRVVGETAYALGKMEGLIGKPVRALFRALDKIGLTGPGRLAVQAAARAGENSNNIKQLKVAIGNQAKKMGYSLHQRVIDKIASNLLSEDIDEFVKGIKTLSGNKRLMKLIEELGKGEE